MLCSLLEGRYTLFFASVDKVAGDIEYLGAKNILQSALNLNELYFSVKSKDYWGFRTIEEFDPQFSNEINVIMKEFKQFPLVFVPRSDDRILDPDPYDIPF